MPELPEVETVRDGLDRLVVGAVVGEVEVFRDYSVRRHDGGPGSFRDQLVGRRLSAAVRRGKFLWLPLAPRPAAGPPATTDDTPAAALLAHLGMSGQLLVRGATPSVVEDEGGGAPVVADGAPGRDGAAEADEWRHPHLRVRLHLTEAPSGARYLDFVDQRTFGHLSVQDLVPDGDTAAVPDAPAGHGSDLPLLPGPVAHIARDLLDPSLDLDALVRRMRRRRTQIKRALLDQTVVSGVGNIYADEALWRAQVHWGRPTDRLPAAQVRRVLESAAAVMREALAQGGTSFDDLYVNVNGQSGYFERSLAVYGRENEACRRCGTLVRRDAFMNRSSFSCPVCQPRPRGLR
ncbi:bifunctional DNA-formamidopyrimidine glycosylase/DNA-(apurinic or apyrimidinic site) lyase [Promicromonospora citrea]|uniref:Formamidopyrimidine-DNA glycosylase n=1 Tax=Promicromonospora citrea TaxID=43677 RepID=A0A8H9GGI4_9MICO|nr:bifunctional DNA-formamidopyrimidine glycosylase/DNA-(apurinic or apyrimidinic site) lyase [Promicromonospora citrea]NNH54354.1 bifunctional DNA-formamidopyrimidine glycosylase/DNA-(apurinic or apyrimidinic site) lyase [Promicromonospora citrea]GGM15881.1 formamidopyrimidine-DNA glycosylase [Promicromonospora citrea]